MLKILLGLTFLVIPISLNFKVPNDNHIGRFFGLILLSSSILFAMTLYLSDEKKSSIYVILMGYLILTGNILFFRYINSIDFKLNRFYQAVAYINNYYRKNNVIPDSMEVEKFCNFPKGMEIYVKEDNNDLIIWTNANYGYGFSYFVYSDEKAQAILVE